MKQLSIILLALMAVTGLQSCSDDDLPPRNTIITNQLCYGDGTQGFNTTGAFNDDTIFISTGVSRTNVHILGEGLSLNDMDEIEGAGPIVRLTFYGDDNTGLQTGVYDVSTLQDVANVTAAYSLDYDSNNTFNTFINLDSGRIRVSPYSTGYFIEFITTDSNGDAFHGNYLGNIHLLP